MCSFLLENCVKQVFAIKHSYATLQQNIIDRLGFMKNWHGFMVIKKQEISSSSPTL